MTLDDELHQAWKDDGVRDALESGEVVSKEKRISDYAWTVSNLMKKGFSLDEALETSVPNEIRDDVREKVISNNN